MVTFQPSERLAVIDVAVVNDSMAEDVENFAVFLSLPEGSDGVVLGSTATAIATIIDDDDGM